MKGSVRIDLWWATVALMIRRTLPWRGSAISETSFSSSGTTTPGSRKLETNTSTALVASCTSSRRARYQPVGVGATGQVARSSANCR